MKLKIIFEDNDLENLVKKIKDYFDVEIKIFRKEMSLFEQYEIRPKGKFIPKIWKYRIVANKGYKFGTLEGENEGNT